MSSPSATYAAIWGQGPGAGSAGRDGEGGGQESARDTVTARGCMGGSGDRRKGRGREPPHRARGERS